MCGWEARRCRGPGPREAAGTQTLVQRRPLDGAWMASPVVIFIQVTLKKSTQLVFTRLPCAGDSGGCFQMLSSSHIPRRRRDHLSGTEAEMLLELPSGDMDPSRVRGSEAHGSAPGGMTLVRAVASSPLPSEGHGTRPFTPTPADRAERSQGGKQPRR